MYLQHFALHEPPFSITPDTEFVFDAPSQQAALATALVALRSGEGFVKITGEVGTGKTLLARRLLELLADEAVTAYVPNPQLAPRQMLQHLARDLSLRTSVRSSAPQLYAQIEAALIAHAEQGRRVVLCIDEAQATPLDTLEALRLLSNLETGKRKLLQIVLFGQPELDLLLALPPCRSLASRIAFAAKLQPLPRRRFAEYLHHRMIVAGWRGASVFSGTAAWLLRRASGGVPRVANIVAHKALMLAFADGVRRVSVRHAWAAARDSRGPRARGPWIPGYQS
jgi:MSHA biogenesis protein MshM